MRLPLKDALKKEFEGKRLDPAQLAKLQGIQQKPKPYSRPRLISWLSVAAAVFITSTLFLIDRTSLDEKIATEVAYNYHKQMEPEVHSADLSEIQAGLPRLGFTLVASNQLKGWKVLGGRYCSIQGRVAAQLKVQNQETGAVHTLYQVPLQEGWEIEPFQTEKDGIVVRTWVEKGLLLSIAGPN